jgi:hypothetical protein
MFFKKYWQGFFESSFQDNDHQLTEDEKTKMLVILDNILCDNDNFRNTKKKKLILLKIAEKFKTNAK